MLLFGFNKEAGINFLGARLHATQLVKAIFSTGPKPQGVSIHEPPACGITGGPVALPQTD
jgi:hypothetical protein